jgi:predicted small secreted protein
MRRLALILAAAASLSACATAQKMGAANDVHALLVSIRDNDQAAFDAHVDRAALKQEIQTKIEAQAGKRYGAIAALVAPGLAQFAGDALVQPSVFRQVARQHGYGEDAKIPNPVLIAQGLKALPDGRVCATKKKDGPCTLVFTKEDGVWKLTGFEGDMKDLRLKL